MLLKTTARGLVATLLIALLLPAAAYAQGEPTPQMVPPGGPYPVGRAAYHWIDPDRAEVHTEDPDDRRALLVELWYPAAPDEDAAPGAYLDAPLAALFAEIYEVAPETMAAVRANAIPEARLAEGGPFPIVLFDPGFSAAPRQYTVLIEELASHGYIVVAPSHPYLTTLVTYPDGTQVEPLSYNHLATLWAPRDIYQAEYSDVWLPDVQFALAQVAALNDAPEGRFAGRLSLEPYGAVGHSQGGRTVTGLCLDDPRCGGAVNLDGGWPAEAEFTFDTPLMLIQADHGVESFAALYQHAFEGVARDFYVLMIPRTTHNSFMDAAFWVPLVRPDVSAEDVAAEQRTLIDYRIYIRAFLDHTLRGVDDPLMAGPSDDFPEVFFLHRDAPIPSLTQGVAPQPAAAGAQHGTLALGEAHVWTYAGQAGEVIDVAMWADRPANQATAEQRREYDLMDTFLVVRGPAGDLLAVNDDGPGTDAAIDDLTLPEDGTYTIEARTWAGQTAGGYTLLITPHEP